MATRASVHAAMSSVELILNGWALRHPLGGVALYTRLLVEALQKRESEIFWRVAIPAPHAWMVSFLPPEKIILVEGSNRIDGYIMAELYWNNRIAMHVRRRYPKAVFHTP